jgi:hypothetical protein
MKGDEVGCACSMCDLQDGCIEALDWERCRKEHHLEDLVLDEWIMTRVF